VRAAAPRQPFLRLAIASRFPRCSPASGQTEARLAAMPACLIGAHHLSRKRLIAMRD